MIEISNILDVEKHISNIDAVIFDLDDTLYSELDYVISGFKKISEDNYEELITAFNEGLQAIDAIFPKEKESKLKEYREHNPNINLYPGVMEMLIRIKESGKKLGLITDGRPSGQKNKIKALGIDTVFDEIIITDELGGIECRKPCIKAYEIMKQKLDVDYKKMVYIGDNMQKDFFACKKLNIKAIHFNNNEGLYRTKR